MINTKLGWLWNVTDLQKQITEGEGEPGAAIPDAVEGSEVDTINAILEVLRTRNIIAST